LIILIIYLYFGFSLKYFLQTRYLISFVNKYTIYYPTS